MRGTPSGHLPPTAFVNFLQNHDQVGNAAFGRRITAQASPAIVRLATAVLMLTPAIPMLFMGQEWGSERPFGFFCDMPDEVAAAVRLGRRAQAVRLPEFAESARLDDLPDPNAASTRDASVLDWDRTSHPDAIFRLDFHRGLIALRRAAIIPLIPQIGGGAGSFRLIGDGGGIEARWRLEDERVLVMTANFGPHNLAWCAPDALLIYRLSNDVRQDVLGGWDLVVHLAQVAT